LGIAVTNTPGKNASAVAELALTLLLDVTRGISFQERSIRKGGWSTGYIGRSLEGKTVGIVGFGHIGQKMAQYLQGFRCRILAYDVYPDQEAAASLHTELCTLDDIAKQSDFISIHVPLTSQTRGLIDRSYIHKMKNEAYLINTSRGPVIKETDLIEALQEGRIAGAGLDVFEIEPLKPDNPLMKMNNVVLSPHVASATFESIDEVGLCVAENIIALYDGTVPPHVVNPEYAKARRA
jgi:phosphoglycerate dehydrogenase-like enzyme